MLCTSCPCVIRTPCHMLCTCHTCLVDCVRRLIQGDSSRALCGALALAQLVSREPSQRDGLRGRDATPAREAATAASVPSGLHKLPHREHCACSPPPHTERVQQVGSSLWILRRWCWPGPERCMHGVGALVLAPNVELLLEVRPPVVRVPPRLPHLRHPCAAAPAHAQAGAAPGSLHPTKNPNDASLVKVAPCRLID